VVVEGAHEIVGRNDSPVPKASVFGIQFGKFLRYFRLSESQLWFPEVLKPRGSPKCLHI